MTEKRVSQVIGEVAESPTTVEKRVSQVIAEVAYTPSGDPATPPPSGGSGAQAAGGAAPVKHTEKAPQWTVDGKPANLVWTSVKMRANGGYEMADFVLPRTREPFGSTRGPIDIWQGSIVRALRDNGDIFYEGKVAAPPVRFQGETKFYTVGAVEELRRRNTRLPYQLAGAAGWVDRESDPFNYNNNEKYDLYSKSKLLGWRIPIDTYAGDAKAGYALMVANWPLQRIAFTLNKSDDMPSFNLDVLVGDDAGSLTQDKRWSLSAANPSGTTFDYILTTPSNTISLVVTADSGGASPSTRRKVWLTRLRVNGIGTDDTYTTSDVIGDIGNRCGYRVDSISGSAVAAIPLDYIGQWSDLADDMARLDDWYWLVDADPLGQNFGSMVYSPWGGTDGERIWRGVNGEGLDCDLDVLPLYNRVDVNYESPAGVPQTLERDANEVGELVDPTPEDVYPFPDPFTLEDPQDDNSLPKSIADNALGKLTKIRCLGSVDISWLDNGQPYDLKPGDLLAVGGFDPELPPQRIAAVEYRANGTVRADIGYSIEPADILARQFRKQYRGYR